MGAERSKECCKGGDVELAQYRWWENPEQGSNVVEQTARPYQLRGRRTTRRRESESLGADDHEREKKRE